MQALIENDIWFKLLAYLAIVFVFFVGLIFLVLIIVYILDITQTKHAIRHNYPVVGRLRYFFEHLGTFFRQYFFSLDREELPFNRAERSWVYRAAKKVDNTTAFGSTRDLRPSGTILFVNCPFPQLGQTVSPPLAITLGQYCKTPYTVDKFFHISGMSYGALSKPAVLALSQGAKQAGIWLNTGEGGVTPYHLQGGADIVFQIGTAKYGVADAQGQLSLDKLRDLAINPQIKMFELKLSQGAKPGKGGILPGKKVTAEIAQFRGIKIGVDSISPNRFPEVDSVESLLDFIQLIRETTGKPVGFKTVIGSYSWIESLFREIKLRGMESAPDFITIDSADGGSGAAPASLIDYMGLPIKESLPMLVHLRKRYGLDNRIRYIASGKLITPADVAWALCAGAEFVVSARGFMFALGCIQAMQCNKDTCPTGITTHRKRLQKGLNPQQKSLRIANYALNMVQEVGIIAHSCGVDTPRDLQTYHAHIVCPDGLSRPLDEIYNNIINRNSNHEF